MSKSTPGRQRSRARETDSRRKRGPMVSKAAKRLEARIKVYADAREALDPGRRCPGSLKQRTN